MHTMCIRNFMKGMMLTTMNTGTRDRLGIRVKPVTSITTITTEASSRIISTNNSSNSRVLEVHRIQTATLPDVQRWKRSKRGTKHLQKFSTQTARLETMFPSNSCRRLTRLQRRNFKQTQDKSYPIGWLFFVFVKSIAY